MSSLPSSSNTAAESRRESQLYDPSNYPDHPPAQTVGLLYEGCEKQNIYSSGNRQGGTVRSRSDAPPDSDTAQRARAVPEDPLTYIHIPSVVIKTLLCCIFNEY